MARECPLKIVFENIFKICNQQEMTIAEVFDGTTWNLTFRRNFGPWERMEWDELLQSLSGVQLTTEYDTVRWMLEPSGRYTTRSLYRHLLNPGAVYTPMTEMWEAKIPLKVKIFMWLLNKDRIQAAEQLKRKNWKGSDKCKMCGHLEKPSHIMFECVVARWLWATLREYLGWRNPVTNISDVNLMLFWNGRTKDSSLLAIIIAAACWSIWLTRNDYVFRDVIITNPDALIYRMISMMRKWSVLSNGDARRRILEAATEIMNRIKQQNAEEDGRLDGPVG